MRWSERETYKFVKLYLSHENLWNTAHPYYKSKERRTKAYRELTTDFRSATGIAINETEARIKIKNLRSTYSQEVRKIIHRSNPDWSYSPTIKWFAEWHKCFKNTLRRKVDESQLEEEDQTEQEEDPSESVWVSCVEDGQGGADKDPFVAPPEDEYSFILKEEPDDTPKQKNNQCRTPSTDQSDRTFRGSMDSTSESAIKEDEFDVYGKYIATQLRQMDLQKALRLQLEIQSLVSEARISELSSKQ